MLAVAASGACRLGGSDMPRPAPEILLTDSRSAFEIDPLLDLTLAVADGGAADDAAPPAPAASSYRADGGVGAQTLPDAGGPSAPPKPAAPPPLDKPRPPQATQSAPPAAAPRAPAPRAPAPPAPSAQPMPGMNH